MPPFSSKSTIRRSKLRCYRYFRKKAEWEERNKRLKEREKQRYRSSVGRNESREESEEE